MDCFLSLPATEESLVCVFVEPNWTGFPVLWGSTPLRTEASSRFWRGHCKAKGTSKATDNAETLHQVSSLIARWLQCGFPLEVRQWH